MFKKILRGTLGFTLLELGVVLLVVSLLTAGGLSIATINIERENKKRMDNKLKSIDLALLAFRNKYNRIPCPAIRALADNNASFGLEDCSGSFLLAANLLAGMLPVRALGLADEFAYDVYGARFTYTVDTRFTPTGAFTTYPITNTTTGDVVIKDGAAVPNTKAAHAIAVLVSHGVNGHGAYLPSGLRKSSGSANANELINCHCTGAAADSTGSGDFIQAPRMDSVGQSNTTNMFDDTVYYWMRSSLYTSTETS